MSLRFSIADSRGLDFEPLARAVGEPSLRFVQPGVQRSGGWPKGVQYLCLEHLSTRPFETACDPMRFEVRILEGTDAETLAVGCRIVAEAARLTGSEVRLEDRERPMSAAAFTDLYDARWVEAEARRGFEALRARMTGSAEPIKLRGVTRELRLGPRVVAGLPTDPSDLAKALTEGLRMVQYPEVHPVYVPGLLEVRTADGTRVVLEQSYGGVPSLLDADVDLVACLPARDGLWLLPLDRLADWLGPRGRWLTEDVYFAPELDAEDLARLQRELGAEAVRNEQVQGRSLEAHREWQRGRGVQTAAPDVAKLLARALSLVPGAVLVAIVGAEAANRPQEKAALFAGLRELSQTDDALVRQVLQGGLASTQAALQAARAGEMDAEGMLASARSAIEAAPPGQLEALRRCYFELGQRIVQSRARGFLVKRVRSADTVALRNLGRALGVVDAQ